MNNEQNLNNTFTNYEQINPQCCCFNLRKVTRAITQYYDYFLLPTGLRATQFTLLVALNFTKAKTLTEIADSLVMDRTTLTRNLKPLEKMELISSAKTLDKRSKAYVLTDKGKELVARCVPLWQQAQLSILESFGENSYRSLLQELEKILILSNKIANNRN